MQHAAMLYRTFLYTGHGPGASCERGIERLGLVERPLSDKVPLDGVVWFA